MNFFFFSSRLPTDSLSSHFFAIIALGLYPVCPYLHSKKVKWIKKTRPTLTLDLSYSNRRKFSGDLIHLSCLLKALYVKVEILISRLHSLSLCIFLRLAFSHSCCECWPLWIKSTFLNTCGIGPTLSPSVSFLLNYM